MLSREQLIEHQVGELQKLNAKLQQEMVLRAAPTFAELLDALENLIRGANSGDANAKTALAKFNRVLDAARDAASPLEIVRT